MNRLPNGFKQWRVSVAQERLVIGVAGGGEAGHSAFLAELSEHGHTSAVRVPTA
jgi:hypothetical protein